MAVPFLTSITLNKNEVQNFKVFNLGTDPGDLTADDKGYFWLNTDVLKLRYWTGTATRDLLDTSSTISGGQISGNISGNAGGLSSILAVASGGTGTNNGSITGTGELEFAAGGSDNNIKLTPSGTGAVVVSTSLTTGQLTATGLTLLTGGLTATENPATFNAVSLNTISNQTTGGGITLNPETSVSLSSKKIVNLADPENDQDAATKKYVDEKVQGLDVKASCLTATTADINLSSPGSSIGGFNVSAVDSRILVKDQSDNTQNGIYLWKGDTSAMVRSSDADTVAKLVSAFTFVEQGTNADSGWTCTVNSGTIGSAAIVWTKFSQAGSYTPGRGITQSGTAFNFAQDAAYTDNQIPYTVNDSTIGFKSTTGTGNVVLATAPTVTNITTDTLTAVNSGGKSTISIGNTAANTYSQLLMYGGSTKYNWSLGAQYNENNAFEITPSTAAEGTTFSNPVYKVTNAGVHTFLDGAGGTRMILNSTGLGIGTASPGSELEVVGQTRIKSGNQLRLYRSDNLIYSSIEDAGSGVGLLLNNANGDGYKIKIAGYDVFFINSSFTQTWYDGAGGTRMTLNSTGLAVGTSGPAYKLDVDGIINSSSDIYALGGRLALYRSAGTSYIDWADTRNLVFRTVGSVGGGATVTNIATLNSNGLGIGGSPNQLLTVYKSDTTNSGIATTAAISLYNPQTVSSDYGSAIRFYGDTRGNNNFAGIAGLLTSGSATGSTGYLSFYTKATEAASLPTERLRIDSSGNVGIGVTPSAWGSSYKAIELNAGNLSNYSTSELYLNQNAYNDGGGWKYKTSSGATQYMCYNGQHRWYVDSGTKTAGQATSFTQAMTLDASGNLAIGATSNASGVGLNVFAQQAIFGNGGGATGPRGGFYADATECYVALDDSVTSTGSGFLSGSDYAYIKRVVSTGNAIINNVSASGSLILQTNTVNRLTISPTGAATFTGDVTVNGTAYAKNSTATALQIARTYNGTLSGSNTEFTVNHNLGTRSVVVQVRQTGSPYAVVITDVEMTDGDNVKIKFATTVTGSLYNVTVIG